ncbi:MAG: hypothetical protein EBR02_02370 [Alphaproteobacteria bacterium]|nr:hypothetical protein [Alphaproteobacteria bacterium]
MDQEKAIEKLKEWIQEGRLRVIVDREKHNLDANIRFSFDHHKDGLDHTLVADALLPFKEHCINSGIFDKPELADTDMMDYQFVLTPQEGHYLANALGISITESIVDIGIVRRCSRRPVMSL